MQYFQWFSYDSKDYLYYVEVIYNMDSKILNSKINKVCGYTLYLKCGIFILSLMIVVIAIQAAGVFRGSEEEEVFALVTIGLTIFSVLFISWNFFLMKKNKNYTNILKVDGEEVAGIIGDTNNLLLNTSTFALGDKYAYFYGELISTPRKLICVKYEEVAYAEFAKWRSNEQIFFYNKIDEWIATVGGYKKKSHMIKSILSSKGVTIK